MKLINEEQILNEAFRKMVIEEIKGGENICRKQDALKRHEVYRDNTVKYVMLRLEKDGLKDSTLALMKNRASNISIAKKIVNKKARTYAGGVQRTASVTSAQQPIEALLKLTQADSKYKKADRYCELQKNSQLFACPEESSIYSTPTDKKYRLKLKVLAPWQYDAIEDAYDREIARVIVLSDFVERQTLNAGPVGRSGDGVDQVIADSPADAGQGPVETFIWWGSKYHFTTDANGKYIAALSPQDLKNPIQRLPFTNVCEDQDGQFWAQGGEDTIEGSILINVILTDMFAISYQQGWGQLVVAAKKLPQRLEGGPHNAFIFTYDEGDPEPKVYFASANPPLEMWMKAAEQYTALLLSSNDLSPSSIANKLDAANFPSGIAMLIEQSEAVGSLEDKQRRFQDVEANNTTNLIAWQNLLAKLNALTPEFQAIGKIPDGTTVAVKFMPAQGVVSESEKLANLQKRKDLGINTMIDLIKMDNPGMDDKEAQKKLEAIMREALSRMASVQLTPQAGQAVGNQNAQDASAAAEAQARQEDQPNDVNGGVNG